MPYGMISRVCRSNGAITLSGAWPMLELPSSRQHQCATSSPEQQNKPRLNQKSCGLNRAHRLLQLNWTMNGTEPVHIKTHPNIPPLKSESSIFVIFFTIPHGESPKKMVTRFAWWWQDLHAIELLRAHIGEWTITRMLDYWQLMCFTGYQLNESMEWFGYLFPLIWIAPFSAHKLIEQDTAVLHRQ
jgi:hypothetical protein